jgi:hypothetical protein
MVSRRGKSGVKRYFNQVRSDIADKLLPGAARAGAKVIAAAASAECPSEEVAKAVTIKVKKEALAATALVTVKGEWERPLALWLEWGTDPHFISVDDSQREGLEAPAVVEGNSAPTFFIDNVKVPALPAGNYVGGRVGGGAAIDTTRCSCHFPPIRIARGREISHALCVVDEAQERARSGPVPPSAGLRLALAFLRLCGAEACLIEQFWKAAVTRSETGSGADAFGRSQEMTAAVNAITRAVGIERSSAFLDALREARRRLR